MAKKNKKKSVLSGTLSKHKKGFGFVDAGDDEDIFIPREAMNGAMDGDLVEIDLLPPYMWDRRREAIVVRIIERAVSSIAGTFRSRRNGGVVMPERGNAEKIYIDKGKEHGARDGDKVSVLITEYPDRKRGARGEITEIIARKGEAGGDITALVRAYDVPVRFPKKVIMEADRAADMPVLPPSDDSGCDKYVRKDDRRDLRAKTVFTIDGADAKDFDDAVSCELNEKGNYVLGVHIADVSHYVREGSALDREAAERGTSIYLPDRVIPMLPEQLSNGICSLNPREDRLTMTCEMEIDRNGNVVRHDIYESIICSSERLVYDDISRILDDTDADELKKRYSGIYEDLMLMGRLQKILNKKKKARGSIDFDLKEAEIVLDKRGVPVDIHPAERGTANMMIEEFMLLANETVAEHFYHMDIPFIYRIHEKPELTKMRELELYLAGFGLSLRGKGNQGHSPGGSVSPMDMAGLLEQIKGRPYENAVASVMLRSMQKAAYDPVCEGHFGLALKYYCHFTSPIRRYPDLMIHRIIKETIHGELDGKRTDALSSKVATAADTSSFCERRAIELEREVEDMKKTEYMSYHLGEEYEGIISGVTPFGLFVQLENTVEGLVRYENIGDDYYEYDERSHTASGMSTGRKFSIGNRLEIKVMRADVHSKEIDFLLTGPSPGWDSRMRGRSLRRR